MFYNIKIGLFLCSYFLLLLQFDLKLCKQFGLGICLLQIALIKFRKMIQSVFIRYPLFLLLIINKISLWIIKQLWMSGVDPGTV